MLNGVRAWRRLLVMVFSLLVLGACVTPGGPATSANSDAAHIAAIEALQIFTVRGGIGIWTEKDSISATVNWQQSGEDLRVKLTAPLGITSLELAQTPGKATLTRGDAPPLQGDSGELLLQQALGLSVPVPLDQLSLWIRGLPGSADDVLYDDVGRLQSLAYQDPTGVRWSAQVRKRTTLNELSVPALITASGGPYNLRLVLKNWSEETAEPAAPADGPKRIPIPASTAEASKLRS